MTLELIFQLEVPADTPGVGFSLLSDAQRVRLGSLAHWSLFGGVFHDAFGHRSVLGVSDKVVVLESFVC